MTNLKLMHKFVGGRDKRGLNPHWKTKRRNSQTTGRARGRGKRVRPNNADFPQGPEKLIEWSGKTSKGENPKEKIGKRGKKG